jgi:hypothetical protein
MASIWAGSFGSGLAIVDGRLKSFIAGKVCSASSACPGAGQFGAVWIAHEHVLARRPMAISDHRRATVCQRPLQRPGSRTTTGIYGWLAGAASTYSNAGNSGLSLALAAR